MKRAVVLALVAFFPAIARGQQLAPTPTVESTAAAPTPTRAPSSAPAAASAAPVPTPVPPAPGAAPAGPPGPEYYVAPPGEAAPAEALAEPAVAEPPLPGVSEPPAPGARPVFEPPVPPEPQHAAPRTAFWAGARLGWFLPFGNAWARRVGPAGYDIDGVPWRDYAGAGPTVELDAGARFSRNYSVFALWERTEFGSGSERGVEGARSDGGDSDFWGLGIRASTDADTVGFLTELAIGYRRARAQYDDGSEVQFTEAPLEARLGIGADVRINRWFSLSPMAAIGVGSFGTVRYVAPNGSAADLAGDDEEQDGHSWVSLTLGAHFDLFAAPQ